MLSTGSAWNSDSINKFYMLPTAAQLKTRTYLINKSCLMLKHTHRPMESPTWAYPFPSNG